MMNYENLALAALDSGATKAIVISTDRVVLSREFYDILKATAAAILGAAGCARRISAPLMR